MSIITKLKQTLELNKEEYLNPLIELIRIDTQNIGHGITGGKEYEGQVYLEKLLTSLGFTTSREEIDEEKITYAERNLYEGNSGHNYTYPTPRFNIFATKYTDKDSADILFNGHIDTMPPGNEEFWTHPPFSPTIEEGQIFGLGTADMKSGLMAAIMAVKLLVDAKLYEDCNVGIMSVADEEGGGNGTLSSCLTNNKLVAKSCVVAECSDGSILTAHMGFLVLEVEVSGKALHCGKKWQGENAIEKAIELIKAIEDVEHRWLMNYKHPTLPCPTINLGEICGGTAASTVPDKCSFKICAHILPSMKIDNCYKEISKSIFDRAHCDSYLVDNPVRIKILQQGNSFELPKESLLIKNAVDAYVESLGITPNVTGSAAGNDARLLSNISKIPTIILGPGKIEDCHTVDEHINLEDYYNHILIYANLILKQRTL